MAQKRKSKPKIKKAHAAKKKARIVRALKKHAPKARPHKKQLAKAKHPERVKKVAAAAKAVAAAKGAKPDEKAGKGPKVKTTAKQALELLEAKVAQVKVKGKRGRRSGKDWLIPPELPKEDAETRRTRLKNLIKLGKERGFLTYSEINDHLPDDLVDAEQIEAIISTFGDMGIQVYDQAPDQEQLLIAADAAPVAQPDEDVEEQAEAALSTVDSRDGLSGAPHARRRNRDREAHRGWPAPHDPRDQRVPDDGQGDPRPRRQGGEGRDAHRRSRRWPDRSERQG
jgi:RNA polymerase primary sigma factor